MWQDYVITIVQIFFCMTLIPMLFAKEKPPLSSSLTTGIALIILSAVFLTLHLWISAVCQTVVGLQWLALAYQRLRSRDVA